MPASQGHSVPQLPGLATAALSSALCVWPVPGAHQRGPCWGRAWGRVCVAVRGQPPYTTCILGIELRSSFLVASPTRLKRVWWCSGRHRLPRRIWSQRTPWSLAPLPGPQSPHHQSGRQVVKAPPPPTGLSREQPWEGKGQERRLGVAWIPRIEPCLGLLPGRHPSGTLCGCRGAQSCRRRKTPSLHSMIQCSSMGACCTLEAAIAMPKPTSRTQPPRRTKPVTAALAGGEGCGGGAWLPVTCLKDNWPAGPCGWTEQSNRTVWALDSCQSVWPGRLRTGHRSGARP